MILEVNKEIIKVPDVYFTSDTHFSHKNIIQFCKRPFSSVTEMNEALIQRWNETIPEDGIVFHLGDFCFKGLTDWKRILERLNGKIYLAVGNHDEKVLRNSFRTLVDLFEDIKYQYKIKIDDREIYLNHYPFLCYGGVYRSPQQLVYQLYGHVHTCPSATGKDFERTLWTFPTQYDVGVDNNNWYPCKWSDLVNKIGSKLC